MKTVIQMIKDILALPLPWKLWIMLLAIVNLGGGIAFVDTMAGKSATVSIIGAAVIMLIIYARCGFVRLLGLGRLLFWAPMQVEFTLILVKENPQGLFHAWLLILLSVNGISLCLDFINVVRFALGDTQPMNITPPQGQQKK